MRLVEDNVHMRPLQLSVAIPQQLEFVEPVADSRRMVSTELMGSHSHDTPTGISVHVWKRGKKYIARGRYEGRPFGENLGENEMLANAKLREILSRIDYSTYVRPSESKKQLVARGRVSRLTLRDLVADFLADKRRSRGRQTANDYSARLATVIDFAEKSENLKRWPLALDIDTDFVRLLRSYLFQFTSSRNGKPGGKPRPLSARQIINILECLRTMLHWARSAQVRKLPADWVMPVTPDLIGTPPIKNPLRVDKIPLDNRIQIVQAMDRWQLCHLIISMVLPLRPDEAAGLLISDVNFEKGWLEFSERLKDVNFNKGKTAFYLPFPEELRPILRACIADRSEGPVLRSRRVFEGKRSVDGVSSMEHLVQLYETELLNQPAETIQAEQDRKLLFRALLSRLGGVTEDALYKEFNKLLTKVGIKNGSTLYTLRSSVTTAMHRANLPHLEMRYLTGHTTSDILNEYTSLDPVGAMKRYFETIQPLLVAVNERCRALEISGTASPSRALSSVEEQEPARIEPPNARFDSTVLGLNSETSVEQKSTANEQQSESTSPQTAVSRVVIMSAEAITASIPTEGTARSSPQNEKTNWWHEPHELPNPNEYYRENSLEGTKATLSMCFPTTGKPDHRRLVYRAQGNKNLWVIRHSAHHWEIYFRTQDMYEKHRERFDKWKDQNDSKQHKQS
jgi:integrase